MKRSHRGSWQKQKQTTKSEIKKLLGQIDTVLLRDDSGSAALWDILTALRGPDNDVGKGATMAVRSLAFPKTSKYSTTPAYGPRCINGAMYAPYDDTLASAEQHSVAALTAAGHDALLSPRKAISGEPQLRESLSPHFVSHTQHALDALAYLRAQKQTSALTPAADASSIS